jgi:hypothetical protein
MEVGIFMMYINGMNEIIHEESLRSFSEVSYPHLSSNDRVKLHKQTFKAAYPVDTENPKNIVKLGDLSKVLR